MSKVGVQVFILKKIVRLICSQFLTKDPWFGQCLS